MNPENRTFTPGKMILVFVIVTVLGSAGVWGFRKTTGILHRRAVREVIPKYLDNLRIQGEQLNEAIEGYYSQFGFYPRDGRTNKEERAATNPLYYELAGTSWNTNLQTFALPMIKDAIRREVILEKFNISSFSNSAIYPEWPTNFLTSLSAVPQETNGIILLGVPTPKNIATQFVNHFSTTGWRYIAEPAEHNTGRFDLWIEVNVLDQTFVIRNWNELQDKLARE